MGCDVKIEAVDEVEAKFQSTHPRGVRHGNEIANYTDKFVSIHAPAWGATCCTNSFPFFYCCFNPRTRVGCDYLYPAYIFLYRVSIHAPAWGATYSRSTSVIFQFCFNPRTRVGCDLGHVDITVVQSVSIHAPAWGATSRMYKPWQELKSFNPRTRVGCDTSSNTSLICNKMCFNPRTRVGCDRPTPIAMSFGNMFQSTHPRGVRRLML